ncbi:uncharacterized protein LOC110684510 [Chenopodium quinoa]|uniref:uncharacterized protein LOC110684510 n=1 Tax=Chenopodium quinoa TaxID=63459 RepID=UPI000B778A6A|nr:uncharacterized protein LOC110684510 [Chenopodium quinoa]
MDAFREIMDECGFRGLGYKGSCFTWQRGLSMETLVQERLDRFIAMDSWCSLFPRFEVIHFPICHSDHAAILLKCGDEFDRERKEKIFRFEKLWLSNEECAKVVLECWATGVGEPMHARIANVVGGLSTWAARTFGVFKKKIKNAEGRLKEIQGGRLDAVLLEQCNAIRQEIDELRRMEESYWYARARTNELRDGDKNTKYFHHKADLDSIIANYFDGLFATDHPSNFDEALGGIEPIVTEEMRRELETEPTKEEIHEALFQMHPTKAPGPGGMHALFFQKFWGTLGGDIINYVKSWWRGLVDLKEVNRTCIVLIPKCDKPKRMMEFRPISLCNVLYKIISKTLANKMKTMLGSIISENQSAFVPNRLIIDNALIAFEIFHGMKRKGEGKDGTIALKLDMSKAYDRVEWVFLEKVMQKLGFPQSWIGRIMHCLNSASFSFKYNGGISGSLIPSRGFRQGDPISPYLFLICAEAFSSLISKAARDKMIHGARVCRGAPRISHLFFADDSILFAKATLQECSKIAEIISIYERASGKKVNLSKTEVAFSKCVTMDRREAIVETLGVNVVDRHEKYLGLPTIHWEIKKSYFCRVESSNLEEVAGLEGKTLVFGGGRQIRDVRCIGKNGNISAFQNLWEASLGYDPSYSWRSIWGSKAILLDGMKWRVGNGSSIRVWDDAWLIGEGCWNMEMVDATFSENDKRVVLDIPLSNSWPCDGVYTVKSGYWLGRLGCLRAWELFHGTSDKYCWSVVWKINGPPKLSHFLWRASKGQMALMEVLHKRHMRDDMICTICGAPEETILHSFFHCKYARDIWASSDFVELLSDAPVTSFADVLVWFSKKINKDKLREFAALTWASWYCRNLHIFESNDDINPVMIAAGFVKLCSDFCSYQTRVGEVVRSEQILSAARWMYPPTGVVKINVDAHISGHSFVQLGVVIRLIRVACWLLR